MPVKVHLPKSGMGIEEGAVTRWLKAEGERVEKGEVLVEVETAKAVQEVLAPSSGVLTKILVQAGETVAVHAALAILD